MKKFGIYLVLFILSFDSFGQFARRSSKNSEGYFYEVKGALKEPEKVIQLDLYSLDKKDLQLFLKKIILFQNLESLRLSFSDLKYFPIEITELKKLKKLDLSYNRIKEIPDEISNLIQLNYLDISWNQVEKLPESISLCKNLTILKVITKKPLILPNQFYQLHNLNSLSARLSKGEIESKIYKLKSLTSLEIYYQSPKIVCELTELKDIESITLIVTHSEDQFEMFECSLEGLMSLKSFRLDTKLCCWPYVDISSSDFAKLKKLLPLNCEISGYTIDGKEEIHDSIQLR